MWREYARKMALAFAVALIGFALLILLPTNVPGSIVVGSALFLIPGLSWWASARDRHGT
jgi:putative effector of murein hydrolase LrgA (UPF0299 family)